MYYFIIVIVIAAVVLRATETGLLDMLNWSIASATNFVPFYAGIDGTPSATDLYPELSRLEVDFYDIRREVVALIPYSMSVPTMQDTYNHMFMNAVSTKRGRKWFHPISTQLWRLIYGKHLDIFNNIATDKWRTLNLILYGHVIADNAELCPRLVSHLIEMDCVQTALLSFMHPGAHVPPHSDPATGVLRYQLAFVVPKQRQDCYMIVDGKRYVWEEGKSVVFDTAFKHEVHNNTDECRINLFVDLHRPLSDVPKLFQQLANIANRYSPGTQAVINNSRIDKQT